MELQDALSRIAAIHQQMAKTRIFRGYRASTTGLTGVIAVLAGAWQAWRLPDAFAAQMQFVSLWVSVAIGCLCVVGAELFRRYRESDSPLDRQLTLQAIEQFLPSIVAGGLVTYVLCDFVPGAIWLLPALWSIFFGLGIFASRRLLPGAIILVGAFYLLWGIVRLSVGRTAAAFSPWGMAVPFGAGQLAAAAILRWKLERQSEAR